MEIVLFAISGACLVLALIGYLLTRKMQDDNGYYYIGGPNGGGATSFLNRHPNSNNVYKMVDSHSQSEWSKEDIQKLFSLGAKAVAFDDYRRGLLVITDEMALAYGKPAPKDVSGGTKGQIFAATHKSEFLSHIKFEELMAPEISYTTPAKQKSVVRQAVAGAVVAGNVGAVIGAMDALNSNIQNKDKVEIHYAGEKRTGIGYTVFSFHLSPNSFKLKNEDVYIAPELEKNIVYGGTVQSLIRQVCDYCWK